MLLHCGLFVGSAKDVVGVDVVVGWCCAGGVDVVVSAFDICERELLGDQDAEEIARVLWQGLEDVAHTVFAA